MIACLPCAAAEPESRVARLCAWARRGVAAALRLVRRPARRRRRVDVARSTSERIGFSSRVRALLPFLLVALCGCPLAAPVETTVHTPVIDYSGAPLPAWESVQGTPGYMRMYRTRTPGGWLVVVAERDGGGCTFVPDPEGAWLRPSPEAAR